MMLSHEYLEGHVLPWWQGVAYFRWDMHGAVCYPIPLNLIVRWARNTFFWVKAARRLDWFAAQQQDAFEQGIIEGKARKQRQIVADLKREYVLGHDSGVALGKHLATEQIVRDIKAVIFEGRS